MGALTSLLGPRYLQHPHRTMHTRPEGSADQAWHKDGHHVSVRAHRPRWLIAFYFPGATTKEMGATGIMEGSYCWAVDRSDPRHDNLGDRLEDHSLALEGEGRVQSQLASQRAHGRLLAGGKAESEPRSLAAADAELRRVEAVAQTQLGVTRARQVDCEGGTVLLSECLLPSPPPPPPRSPSLCLLCPNRGARNVLLHSELRHHPPGGATADGVAASADVQASVCPAGGAGVHSQLASRARRRVGR